MNKSYSDYLRYIKDIPKNSQSEDYYEQVDSYIKTLNAGLKDEDVTIRIICQRGLIEFAENVNI
jgi:hypothetical protein